MGTCTQQYRIRHALLLLLLTSLLGTVMRVPLLADPQKDSDSPLKPWTLEELYADGLFEIMHHLTLNNKGLAVVSAKQGIGSREGTVCFMASDAQMAEIRATLRQLNLSGAPKPVPQKKQVEAWDMPGYSFTVTYGGNTYDLAAEYNVEAQKHLSALVSQLTADGEKRIAAMKDERPVGAGPAPCPERTAAH